MNPRQLLKHAGIAVTVSSIDVPTFRQIDNINVRAERFIRFQNALISTPQTDQSAAGAHLVAFELADPLAFASMEQLDHCIVATAFGTALEFGTHSATSKRYLLGQLTKHCMSLSPEWHTRLQFNLIDLLRSVKDYQQFDATRVLTELRCDQIAWSFKHLPMALFSHVSGINSCTPLSSDCWQRQRTELAPPMVLDAVDNDMAYAASNLLDATYTTQGTNTSAALISQAINCLSIDPSESTKECLSRWSMSLDTLTPRLQEYIGQVGVVISWIAHLVEHGTVNAQDADVHTRRRYAQVLAHPLYKRIRNLSAEPTNWTKLERFDLYTALVTDGEAGDKRALSAAVASFQDFLLAAYEVQPVQANLSRYVPDPVPRAQQVFTHEVERISSWFSQAQLNDESLRLRLQSALWMSYAAPFRIHELLGLRMSSIGQLENGQFEIWITPTREESLKTDAGRRRVWIREPKACTYLRELMDHRVKDCATSKDLLFARGVDGGVAYQAGRLRRMLLNSLKASTGDARMTIYALRHSFVCRKLEALLLSSSIANFNRLTHLAAEVGHESIHTTLQFYFHRMEWPLRVHINAALIEQLHWTSHSAARYLCTSAAALRQRLTRPQSSAKSLGELLINLDTLNSLGQDDLVNWSVPIAPHFPKGAVAGISPSMVLNLLLQLEAGRHSDEVLAHRFGIDRKMVLAAVQHVAELTSYFSPATNKRTQETSTSAPTEDRPLFTIKKALQSKYAKAVQKLSDHELDDSTLRDGVAAWMRLRNKYGYIALDGGLETTSFLALLRHLGFEVSNLCVVACAPPTAEQIEKAKRGKESDALQRALLQYQARKSGIADACILAMNALPGSFYQTHVPYHPTRPPAYLLWKPADSEDSRSAASDLRGLDSLFLVLSTYLHLASKEVV